MKRKSENNDDEESNKKQKIYEDCPICLEAMKDNNIVVTKCNHKFCFSCLMSSCCIKNNCPLCREEIKEYKNKNLPKFKHINMFENILSSINNPHYNLYELIDFIRDIIFEEMFNFSDNISENELSFKNSILRRLENSQELINNIDCSLLDNVQDFIGKIIVDNTIRMINWYSNNY